MVIRPGDVPGLSMARLGRLVLQEKKAKFGDDQFDDAGCKEAFVEVMQLALKLYAYSGPSGGGGKAAPGKGSSVLSPVRTGGGGGHCAKDTLWIFVMPRSCFRHVQSLHHCGIRFCCESIALPVRSTLFRSF